MIYFFVAKVKDFISAEKLYRERSYFFLGYYAIIKFRFYNYLRKKHVKSHSEKKLSTMHFRRIGLTKTDLNEHFAELRNEVETKI